MIERLFASEDGYAVAEGSDGLINVLGFLESHAFRACLTESL